MMTMGFWAESCCSAYTTRSYTLDGETEWTANYWAGTSGTPPSEQPGICMDAAGNTYVAGLCAVPTLGGATWSLISYDPSGGERWRVDVRAIGRVTYPSFDGHLFDCVCTDDQQIVCLGSPRTFSGPVSFWTFDTDGNEIAGTYTYIPQLPSPTKLLTIDNQVSTLPYPAGWGVSEAACFRGSSKWLYETGIGGAVGDGIHPSLVEIDIWASAYPVFDWDWAFWGMIGGTANPPKTIRTICTSPDLTKVYVGGAPTHAVLGGVGVRYRTMRLIPDIAYTQSSGEGLPVASGDSIVWGTDDGGLYTVSHGTSDGVVMSGGGNPTIQYFADSDGSRIWGHRHQNVSAIAGSATRVVTHGAIKQKRDDQSFV